MPVSKGSTTFAVLAVGGAVAACQSAPAQYAGTGLHVTYSAAATGAGAVRATGMGLYNGAGTALRAPFHDLNLMQDKIAPVLLRAETRPYDLAGVNSCNDVLNRVSELDLALGPDVDTPKQKHRTRSARGADFAASTALDAAGSAAEHFIPMRGTIRQISGAKRYDDHVKHATLAGETRRSFLKAVGMSHNCTWPAAPLDFAPVQVADVAAPWIAPAAAVRTASGPVLLASTSPVLRVTPRPGAAAPAVAARDAASAQFASAARPYVRTPVLVSTPERLAIPSAATGGERAQAWRPSQQAALVSVSASMGASNPVLGTGSAAPWGASTFSAPADGRP